MEGTPSKSSSIKRGKPRRSTSVGEDDVLQSIASKSSVLLHPQVTLTCYIPTSSVGAAIGRRGSTILQIQRHAQQTAGNSGPVRVSIVGHDEDEEQVPYTYSDLDWSSPHWTPVVIRADPCAALAAGQRLLDIVGEIDDVVLDLPLSRQKHASLIGKRGLVLASLSADTNVRIMVPSKEVRHDVVQLEGSLERVRKCLERVLCLCESKPQPMSLQVKILPSQTKLRNVSRKTETTIRKKKLAETASSNEAATEEVWQLTISGNTTDSIQAAASMLERWHDEQSSSLTPQQHDSTSPTSPRTYTRNNNNLGSGHQQQTQPRRGRSNRNSKGGGKNGNNNNSSSKGNKPQPTNVQ
mmetsp:Transcript_1529/g.2085  ORF Transcript_1529/g.2085 Transcript_1529/m.2085 type:complete len:353 (+) Transcript_1529:45-1103(+)